MKKAVLFAAFIFCIVIVSANSSSAGDIWPVGTIIQSILEEKPFQDQMGSEWVLMDGRPVSKSDEISAHLDGTTDASGNILLPNARGKFLRMLDQRSHEQKVEDETKGDGCDPEDNRILTGYQSDAFQGHTHSHAGHGNSGQNAWPSGFVYMTNLICNYKTTGPESYQNYGTPKIANETRPKNIAVNYFIKIRNCQSDKCK